MMKPNITPVGTFQRITNTAPLRAETREAIQNTVLQFYVQNSQPEDDAEGLTACYERLSQEDKLDGESNSIINQKKILEKYCRDHGYTAIRHYDEDDGYSGTNFNRPGFQRMLADIKAGKIKRVIVKDMSRLGRNYLQVGMYTEMVFPEYGVHFIAVNDGVDSTKGDSEFTAIRNVFNEMFAKDTSKKIKATWQSKGRSGEHLCTVPPYGYMKAAQEGKGGPQEGGDLHPCADVEEQGADAGEEQRGLNGQGQAIGVHQDGHQHRGAEHGEHVLQAQDQHLGHAQAPGVPDGRLPDGGSLFFHVFSPLICFHTGKKNTGTLAGQKRETR